MHKLRYLFLLVLFCLPMMTSASDYREGKDYKLLKQPLPVTALSGEIEVDTIFWYGCPHCYDLSKLQVDWKKNQSADVELVDVPVIFGKPWQAHAQLFYTLDEMKLLDKAHFSVFDAVQEQGHRLDNEDEIADFMKSRFNVKPEEFKRAYSSFGVRNQTQKANAISRGAQLTGVPAIIVNGRYVVDPAFAGGLENMLKVTDFLVKKVRDEKSAKQAVDVKEKASGKKAY